MHGEQRVGEAEDAARVLAGAPGDEGRVLQRVVGAMDDAVAVEDGEQRLAVVCHGEIIRLEGADGVEVALTISPAAGLLGL